MIFTIVVEDYVVVPNIIKITVVRHLSLSFKAVIADSVKP